MRLTEEGLALVDDLVTQHVANEHRLVAGLSDLERSRLAHLLESWGRSSGRERARSGRAVRPGAAPRQSGM